MAQNGSNKKVANSLVIMSSAAVLAVYAAGYVRTRPAADRLAQQTVERSLARETPPDGASSAAAPIPAASAHPERKHIAPEAPILTASATPAKTIVHVPKADATPLPRETPAPVAAPAAAPVTPAASIVQQPAEVPAVVPASVPTPAPAAPAPTVWKDGKYIAWGGSRHGDIQATVTIEGGRILSAEITDCQTRYPCDIIDKLPPQVAKRQSPNVDRVGGATESADAFYSAVFFALKQAQ